MSSDAPAAQLGFAERFILQVGSIPRLQQRLECLQYMQRFGASLEATYAEIGTLGSACQQLQGSALLRRFLSVVLHLGNTLNRGSFRAGAEAFRIECLTRLAEVRANRAGLSLLQYAVGALTRVDSQRFGSADGSKGETLSVSCLAEQLSSVKGAAKLDIAEIGRDVKSLAAGFKKVVVELEAYGSAGEPLEGATPAEGAPPEPLEGDRFKEMIAPFVEGATSQLSDLERIWSELGETLASTKSFFAEEPKLTVEVRQESTRLDRALKPHVPRHSREQSSTHATPTRPPLPPGHPHALLPPPTPPHPLLNLGILLSVGALPRAPRGRGRQPPRRPAQAQARTLSCGPEDVCVHMIMQGFEAHTSSSTRRTASGQLH